MTLSSSRVVCAANRVHGVDGNALEKDGLGGDRKIFPVRTWVSEITIEEDLYD